MLGKKEKVWTILLKKKLILSTIYVVLNKGHQINMVFCSNELDLDIIFFCNFISLILSYFYFWLLEYILHFTYLMFKCFYIYLVYIEFWTCVRSHIIWQLLTNRLVWLGRKKCSTNMIAVFPNTSMISWQVMNRGSMKAGHFS